MQVPQRLEDVCGYVVGMGMQVPLGAGRRHQILWGWSYKWF